MASSGLHSNGYSLVRHVFLRSAADGGAGWALDRDVPELGRTLGEEDALRGLLLNGHRYVAPTSVKSGVLACLALTHNDKPTGRIPCGRPDFS